MEYYIDAQVDVVVQAATFAEADNKAIQNVKDAKQRGFEVDVAERSPDLQPAPVEGKYTVGLELQFRVEAESEYRAVRQAHNLVGLIEGGSVHGMQSESVADAHVRSGISDPAMGIINAKELSGAAASLVLRHVEDVSDLVIGGNDDLGGWRAWLLRVLCRHQRVPRRRGSLQ